MGAHIGIMRTAKPPYSVITSRPSGLLIPHVPPPAAPEHPVRQVIRDGLLGLAEKLRGFVQTTHGHVGPRDIADVAACLERAYDEPSAHTISNLSQSIARLGKC